MNTSSSATTNALATEDKTVAILSYITLIGFIIAIVLHGKNKTRLGAYHLRQSLGLILTSFLVLIPILGWILWIGVLVFWVLGLVAAINGQQKPVPLLGEKFQSWFGNAFE